MDQGIICGMDTQTGILDTDGARIYYEMTGDGPAAVFVHAGVANLRMWDEQAATFSGAYRVIRYDTRGYGKTRTDAVAYSNRADLIALLDHLGVDRAHLVGSSRGGQIALDTTLEYPDRVRTLTVAAGGVGGYESPDELPEDFWAPVEAMEAAKDWSALAAWEADFWASGSGQPAERVPTIHAQVHAWVLDNYLAELESGEPIRLDPPAEHRLPTLRAPLLVMLGTLDEPATSDHMRHLAASVPDARLEEFEAAHMINLEFPARFDQLVREHFARA